MKLISTQIQNFRCIDDTTPFSVRQVTCLVGKNESGKTAILQALERLNPCDESKNQYNKLQDYPRRYYADYSERHPRNEAQVLNTQWELNPGDIELLEEEFGPGCLSDNKITIFKCYEHSAQSGQVSIDESKSLQYMMGQAGLKAAEKKSFAEFDSSQKLYKHLQSLPERKEAKTALMERLEKYRDHSILLHAVDLLSKRLPKFLYFSQYSRMNGDVSIEKIRQNKADGTISEGDEVFLAFLAFAGTSLDELAQARQYEQLNARCEAASIKITDQIFDYWSQNKHLAVKFEIQAGQPDDPTPFNQGNVMHARVYNHLHRMTVPFSDRSAGFIWFFSFLVLFSQVREKHGNIIILLDEPGLNLHGTAQRDLLRYIKEKLAPHHQVIYTTHSPFMVPPDDLASVRTVEDVVREPQPMRFEVLGTKVGDNILSTDPETLFPLQGALGYEITQSLFIGAHTLLVEGPSDILYLQAASAALKARGHTGLDSRWVICPSGGLDKVHAFVSLFAGNKLHVAVLSDFAKGQRNKVEQLKKSELLKAGHVYAVTDFCDQEEADSEDLFSSDLFASLINAAYVLPESHQLTAEKLEEADMSTPRRVKKAEAYFRVLPDTIPVFDHFTPAYWLIQNPKFLAGKAKTVTETLKRFSEIFDTFNKLL